MDLSLVWTAVGPVAGVAAVGVAGWQIRLAIVDHQLRPRPLDPADRGEPYDVTAARRSYVAGR